jgi:hypothetical protein
VAHFIAPTSGNINADYHVDNRMAVGSIRRMIIPPEGDADIILGWCPASLKVRSNNPNVVANPIPERPYTEAGGRILTIQPIARTGGAYIDFGVLNSDGWSWAPGSPWPGNLLVNVEPRKAASVADGLVKLGGISRALNSTDTPVPYDLTSKTRVSTSASPEAVFGQATVSGRVDHLVFSCHGHIVYEKVKDDFGIEQNKITDSIINLGTGLNRDNIKLFERLSAAVSGGVIWCCGCAIGNDNEINNPDRARKANAFFVAPVMYMQIKPGSKGVVPPGQIDMYKRFLPKVWTPGGGRLDWDHFVHDYAKTLKFSIV